MTSHETRYRCRSCGTDKWLPESPLRPTRLPRTGCEQCNRLTRHYPVGSGPFHAHPDQ